MKKRYYLLSVFSAKLLLSSLLLALLPSVASAQSSGNIQFADAGVKAICIQNWDTNGDGELSYAEAAAVTDLGIVFKSRYSITSFDELQYFTGLTSIADQAFYYCFDLKSVTIPANVTTIGKEAFYLCSLSSVIIPASVTSIGEEAFVFSLQGDLSSVKVEQGNTVYDSRNGCNAIIETASNALILGSNNTIIPSDVTSIGNYAFFQRKGLTNIAIPSGVKSLGINAFANCTGLTSVTIPSSVTTLNGYSFCGCSGLTSVTISEGVTFIGDGAFRGCTSLTSLAIPSTVTAIVYSSYGAFSDCSGLTSITVDAGNPVYDSRNGCNAIIATATNELITGCQNTVIPSSVTSIGECAFRQCSSLTSLTIPSSVTNIGTMAFFYCTGLTSINIPDGVTRIAGDLFGNCSSLTNISIPSSVKSIGNCAFMSCTSLASVTIPSGVTSIGYMAFYECTGLTSVTSLIKEPFEISADVFQYRSEVFTTATLNVPVGTKAKYAATPAWNKFQSIEEIHSPSDQNIQFADAKVKEICVANWDTNGDGELNYDEAAAVTSLGYPFYYNKEITSFDELQYFTGLTSIGDVAFDGCSNLKSVIIPQGVKSIEEAAFMECLSLKSITIPSNVTSIGNLAFTTCHSLTSLTIEEGVKSIGENAFSSCGLTSLVIPSSVTSIESSSFAGCSSLTSITVNEGNLRYDSRNSCNAIIETTGNKLIVGCKNTVIPSNVTSIGENAFYWCTDLTSLTIHSNVTSIGDGAFWGCSGLISITVDEGNKVYDSRNGCNAIIETATNRLILGSRNTIIPSNVTSIASGAFYYIPGLTSVTIPSGVTSIGMMAFAGCDDLKEVISCIKEPFPLEWAVFISGDWNNYSSATLYVPVGTKEKYEETESWNKFQNIVEMDMAPIEDGETVEFSDDINENTDLNGNVVGDIYYNISSGDGGYDPTEGCIVVTTPTDDSVVNGQDIFGEDFQNNFTGIVFKVPAGKGTVKVEAQTIGTMVMKVKIGDNDPIEMELEGRLKVSFPYNVTEPTYVYIYGGSNSSQAIGQRAGAAEGELKLYGIEVTTNGTGINDVERGSLNVERYFTLDGRKVDGVPAKKGLYIVNGRKVVIK